MRQDNQKYISYPGAPVLMASVFAKPISIFPIFMSISLCFRHRHLAIDKDFQMCYNKDKYTSGSDC